MRGYIVNRGSYIEGDARNRLCDFRCSCEKDTLSRRRSLPTTPPGHRRAGGKNFRKIYFPEKITNSLFYGA